MATSGMKIGLFGGTFDPPHVGHRFIAEEAVKSCGLTQFIFIPCHQSPHKESRPVASDAQRLAMLQLTISGLPWASVSDHELQQDRPSFSWETAAFFAAQFPEAELFWILGADQWVALERWGKPELLAKLLTFIVLPRDGVLPQPNPKFRAHFLTAQLKASATEIRNTLRSTGIAPATLMPEVADYIRAERLYQ